MTPDSAERLLDDANARHHDDTAAAAERLRALDPAELPAARWPLYAHLLNHVLGETQQAWPEALERLQSLVAQAQPEVPMPLWRQLGAAAFVNGRTDLLQQTYAALTAACGATQDRAHEVISLHAATFQVPGLAVKAAGDRALSAVMTVDSPHWPTGSPLDAMAAAGLNNLAGGLLERPHAELQQGPLRSALARAAEQAHRLWCAAGTWVNEERALYLRAMCSLALGEPHRAYHHALAALALLDTHDADHTQDIDRAFIELERWQAADWLGLEAEAAQALGRAEALIASFRDEGLSAEFAQRRAKLPEYRQ